MRPRSLSGKLIIVTLGYVIVIEILILALFIATYRVSWLEQQFKTGKAVSIALQNMPPDQHGEKLARQLLETMHIDVIAIHTQKITTILATRHMPRKVDQHFEVATPENFPSIPAVTYAVIDAVNILFFGENKIIRITGPTAQKDENADAIKLELVMSGRILREAIIAHARNIFMVSLILSIIISSGIFWTLKGLFIRPLQKLSRQMLTLTHDTHHDAHHKVEAQEQHDEIKIAQEQFRIMHRQVRKTLVQQKRLADLGLAVSKINHDLRNILSSARLFSDRLSHLKDPAVQRLAPRLVRIIDRAVSYTNAILTYGKAEETPPDITLVRLYPLFEEVAQLLALDVEKTVAWKNEVPKNMEVAADSEQLFRVLLNLCRNSVQAMTALDTKDLTIVRRLTVRAEQARKTNIFISDTGAGIADKDREKIFSAFQTSSNGTGLGLAIAAEIVRAHDGSIRLLDDTRTGTHFKIILPNP